MTSRRFTVQPRIVALVQPGTAYSTAGIVQALGLVRTAARQALDRLTTKGVLVRRKIGIDCVYFATQADADAWSEAEAREFAKQQKAKRLAAANASTRRSSQRDTAAQKIANRLAAQAARDRARADKAQAAPVVIAPRQSWADTEPDMSRARRTVAPPTPDYRWHVDPQSVPRGACVLRDTGPRWSDYALARGAR